MKELFPVLCTSFRAFILLFFIYFVVCIGGIVFIIIIYISFPHHQICQAPSPSGGPSRTFSKCTSKQEGNVSFHGWLARQQAQGEERASQQAARSTRRSGRGSQSGFVSNRCRAASLASLILSIHQMLLIDGSCCGRYLKGLCQTDQRNQ